MLKKYCTVFCIYFAAMAAVCLIGCSKSDEGILPLDNSYVFNSVNHRGYYTAPENTLAAYYESYQNGFTMVECDVAFTKDGVAVLLHDETVDRTSDGTGQISSLTLEEVRALDFGSWKSPEYEGEQIPTFEEFIIFCRDFSLRPYVEIKKGVSAEQVKLLVDTVTGLGMKNKVTWISFSESYLKCVLKNDVFARVGYVVLSINEEVIQRAVGLRTGKNKVFVDCDFSNVDSEAIAMCKDNLLPLEVWTVNLEQDLLALDPYISGVTSDKLNAGNVLY